MAQPQKRASGNCKVLSVVWYKVFPARFGGQKAIVHFNDALAQHAELTCVCSSNNILAKDSAYPVLNCLPVSKSQFLNPLAWRRILQVGKKQHVTHLLLEFPYYGILGIFYKKFHRVKLVVNTHNIEYLRFREMRKWWWPILFVLEKWTLQRADLVLFKTKSDLLFAKQQFRLHDQQVSLVPYGVTLQETARKQNARKLIAERYSIAKDKKILLFAGTLDYLPNAEAVKWISTELVPLLKQGNFSFKVLICGRLQYSSFQYLKQHKSESVCFVGDVDDIENYFLAADVFVNPVQNGGGIQTKIMDALSYHLNVVCFQSKCKEIQHAENKLYAVQDGDADKFANATIAAAKAQSLTPDAFFETYNWRTIAAKASNKICSL